MGEKKEIKVSLTTVILLFVVFILIVALGGMYFYYNYKIEQKDNENAKITNQSSNLIDEPQKDVNDVEISTNITVDYEEAKRVINKYFELIGAREGSPKEILKIIGFYDAYKNVNKEEEQGNITADGFANSQLKYYIFKEKMTQYMTEEVFLEEFQNDYKNVIDNKDGILYVSLCGGSGIETEIQKIELVSSKNNIDTFSLTTKEYPPEEGEEWNYTVKLEKRQDNSYVIYNLSYKN